MLASIIFMNEIPLIVLILDNFRVHLGKHPKSISVPFHKVLELNRIQC